MIYFPSRQTKITAQFSKSKVLGFIWSSFNLDLYDDIATIKISPRLRINTSGVLNQGRMVAARVFDQRIFAICGTRVFNNSAQNLISTFTEDGSSGAVTAYDPLYSDMELFNSTLVTTSSTKVLSKAANSLGTGAWTQRATISASGIHKLHVFQRHNRVYYFDGDQVIKSLDTSWVEATSGNYFLSLNPNYGIFNTMISDLDNMWIGTINTTPSTTLNGMKPASILRWDGISSSVFEYKIKAAGILAFAKDDNNIVHAIDTNGCLLKYTGGGFSEIDRLPINKKLLKNAMVYGYANFIHPNGFYFTKNGTFKILVNNLIGDNGTTIIENFPSGVWEWSKDKGFVHANSATLNTLANSTITDYGQNRVSAVGALYEPNLYSESASGKSNLICGIDYYSDASTAVSGIFVDDPLNTIQKYGYFVTSWIFSQSLKDSWKQALLKMRQLLANTDKIVIKYRKTEATSTEISITWVNTTSFTTTTDVTAYVGYEVEVLQGTGSGLCSHIVSVTNNAGTYTVVVDETYTGVTTGTAKARVQNWKKASSYGSQADENAAFPIGVSSVRIQVKVCALFTGDDEIFELGIDNARFE